MRADNNEPVVGKLPYKRPELRTKGSVAELTQQTGKKLGTTDGYYFLDPNNPITNIS